MVVAATHVRRPRPACGHKAAAVLKAAVAAAAGARVRVLLVPPRSHKG